MKLPVNKPLLALIFLVIVTALVSHAVISDSRSNNTQKTAASPSPTPTNAVLAEATLSPSPSPKIATKSALPKPSYPIPNKQSYIIAAFGDSMVETMGDNLDYLQKSLTERYPKTKFKLYNYGIGSQNVIEGLSRFYTPYIYKNRNFPPINQINADIIIISSFGYNPLTPYDKDKHYQILMNLVKEAQKTGSKVYLLSEIAPIKTGFGSGPGGVNWTEEKINEHVPQIINQLENAVGLSKTLNVPLINAYKASQVDGKYGNPKYVSAHDHIHPSVEGEIFMANLIATTLKL